MRKYSFPPVYAPDARILLLGTLPGEVSLKASQYYAHPRNQFWRLLGEVLNTDLATLPYPQRLERVVAHGVALWDVVAGAERQGSLDGAMRAIEYNSLASLVAELPGLRAVGFKGAASYKARHQLGRADLACLSLPSSSPAYTRPFEEKLTGWMVLRDYL